MALVVSMSVFAKCYSSPAGDSLDISLRVTASCVRVLNTRVLRKYWGLTLKPSAGTNDSSKEIDLMFVQACQMCLDLALPQPDRSFAAIWWQGCVTFVPVAPTWWRQLAGLALFCWAGYSSCLPALPAPAGTEVLTLGCPFLKHGLKVAKLHHVPDINTWLFSCWKKKSLFFSLSVLYVALEEKFFLNNVLDFDICSVFMVKTSPTIHLPNWIKSICTFMVFLHALVKHK